MEITSSNYRILHEKPLQYDDIVFFTYNNTTHKYEVRDSYLFNINGWNDAIFNDLRLIKEHVATEAYGYTCIKGDWPVCHDDDYAALTRLVIFLFEEIERKEHSETYTKSISSNPIKIKISIEPQIKIKLK